MKNKGLGDDPFEKKSNFIVHPSAKDRMDQESTKEEAAAQEDPKPTEETRSDLHDDFDHIQKVLDQLGEELDEFHRDPKAYDRKRLEGVVKEFIYQLKTLLADTGYFARIKDSLQADDEGLTGFATRLLTFFKSDEVDEYGLDREFEMAIKPFFDFLYYKYFRVEVDGIDNIPYSGKALIVSNHGGVVPMDGAMLKVALFNEHPARRDLRFLVDDFVFHFPFLGTTMNRIGGVRACPENAERLLNSGEIIAVFPEGIKGISKLFKDRYHLERFGRGGSVKLAMKTKSPIVPVAVIGAEEIFPLIYKSHILARPLGLPFIPVTPFFPLLGPLGAIPLPTKWHIRFGEPIPYEDYTSRDLNDGIIISRETAKLRDRIQEMVKEGLKERRSIFFE